MAYGMAKVMAIARAAYDAAVTAAAVAVAVDVVASMMVIAVSTYEVENMSTTTSYVHAPASATANDTRLSTVHAIVQGARTPLSLNRVDAHAPIDECT